MSLIWSDPKPEPRKECWTCSWLDDAGERHPQSPLHDCNRLGHDVRPVKS